MNQYFRSKSYFMVCVFLLLELMMPLEILAQAKTENQETNQENKANQENQGNQEDIQQKSYFNETDQGNSAEQDPLKEIERLLNEDHQFEMLQLLNVDIKEINKLKFDDRFLLKLKELMTNIEEISMASPRMDQLEKTFDRLVKERINWPIELETEPENTLSNVERYLKHLKEVVKNIELRKDQKVLDCIHPFDEKIKTLIPLYSELLEKFTYIKKDGVEFDENLAVLFTSEKEKEKEKNNETNQKTQQKIDNQQYVNDQIEKITVRLSDLKIKQKALQNLTVEIDHEENEYDHRIALLNKKIEIYKNKKKFMDQADQIKLQISMTEEVKRIFEETKNSHHEVNQMMEEKEKNLIQKRDEYKKKLEDLPTFTYGPTTIVDLHRKSTKNEENSDIKDELFERERTLQIQIEDVVAKLNFDQNNLEFSKKMLVFLESYLDEISKIENLIKQQLEFTFTLHYTQQKISLKNLPIFSGISSYIQVIQQKEYLDIATQLINNYQKWDQEERSLKLEKLKNEKMIEAMPKEIELSQKSLNDLKVKLKKDQELNLIVKELEKLPTPELLQTYYKAKSEFDAHLALENQLRKEFVDTKKEINQLLEDRRLKLSDPVLRQFEDTPSTDLNQFVTEAQRVFIQKNPQVKLPEITIDSSNDSKNAKSAIATTKELQSQIDKTTPINASTLEKELYFNDELRSKLPPRLTYYQEYQKYRDRHKEILDRRKVYIDQLTKMADERKEIVRQVWRCATLLYRRSNHDLKTLRSEIEPFQTQIWVSHAQTKETLDLEATQRVETLWFELEPDFKEMITPLINWEKELDQLLHLIKNKDELSQTQVIKKDEDLSPTEKSKKENDLNQLMEKDEAWYYSLLWAIIPDQNTKHIEDMLRNLYQELLDYQSIEKHLAKQKKFLTEGIGILEEQRTNIEKIYQTLKKIVDIYERRVSIEKVKLLSLIKGEMTIPLDSDFKEIEREVLDLNEANLIKDAETFQKHFDSFRIHFYHLQKYRSYLKEIKNIIEPQGFFDKNLGKIRDQSAQLETEIERLKEPIERLIGTDQAITLQKGIDQEINGRKTELSETEQSGHKRKGEITKSREKRFRENIKYLLKALLFFCLIPIIGYFVSKSLNSIGQKLLNIIKMNSNNAPLTAVEIKEKEERASTLFHVSKTLVNIVIMIICLIYMLKSINVDVTPIIASAGVLGLALAFGSQALVKDFFAGFFILLENQYNIGDVVKINGIQGKIEQITLRLTILRDIEGTMHFIPNGAVTMVSNSNKGWAQARIEIGVAYQSEPELVLSALAEVAEEMKTDETMKDKILNMEVMGIERFDDSAVIYRIHIQVIPGEQWGLARACRIKIYHKFKQKGIEIPFPHLVIHKAQSNT
jgi:small-conductance mechanosensitive channel